MNIIQSEDKEGLWFMGKCKRRNGSKPVLDHTLTREKVIAEVVYRLKHSSVDDEVRKMLLLFGISKEELTEAGATYEEVISLKKI